MDWAIFSESVQTQIFNERSFLFYRMKKWSDENKNKGKPEYADFEDLPEHVPDYQGMESEDNLDLYPVHHVSSYILNLIIL